MWIYCCISVTFTWMANFRHPAGKSPFNAQFQENVCSFFPKDKLFSHALETIMHPTNFEKSWGKLRRISWTCKKKEKLWNSRPVRKSFPLASSADAILFNLPSRLFPAQEHPLFPNHPSNNPRSVIHFQLFHIKRCSYLRNIRLIYKHFFIKTVFPVKR